jgi:hypothetical protein
MANATIEMDAKENFATILPVNAKLPGLVRGNKPNKVTDQPARTPT